MENSLRHGGYVTRICFSFQVTDREGMIICQDDGVGISLDDKNTFSKEDLVNIPDWVCSSLVKFFQLPESRYRKQENPAKVPGSKFSFLRKNIVCEMSNL